MESHSQNNDSNNWASRQTNIWKSNWLSGQSCPQYVMVHQQITTVSKGENVWWLARCSFVSPQLRHERGRVPGRSQEEDAQVGGHLVPQMLTGEKNVVWPLCLFPYYKTQYVFHTPSRTGKYTLKMWKSIRMADCSWQDIRAGLTFCTAPCVNTHWSLAKTHCIHAESTHTNARACSVTHLYSVVSVLTVLSIHCVGRCVRYTCWQTRFLCVRLSGSGCLTPPASLVWRQVRWGHISSVPSDPVPCDLSYCHSNSHWKPWLLDSLSTAQPWSHTTSPFIWSTLSSLSMLYRYWVKGPNANIRALLVAVR